MKNIFNKRFSLLYSFISTYVLISFGIRISLYALSFDDIDFSLISIIKILSLGFFFDLSVAFFFSTIYYSYLLALPSKLFFYWLEVQLMNYNKTLANRVHKTIFTLDKQHKV